MKEKEYPYSEVGLGWWPLIDEAYQILDEYNEKHKEENMMLGFTQIKEKYGGLCLYLNHYVPEVYNKIHDIEERSFHICEKCGSTENVTTEPFPNSYYVYTLCDECRKN